MNICIYIHVNHTRRGVMLSVGWIILYDICVCIYIYIYVYIYIYLHVYIHIQVYMYIHTYDSHMQGSHAKCGVDRFM